MSTPGSGTPRSTSWRAPSSEVGGAAGAREIPAAGGWRSLAPRGGGSFGLYGHDAEIAVTVPYEVYVRQPLFSL